MKKRFKAIALLAAALSFVSVLAACGGSDKSSSSSSNSTDTSSAGTKQATGDPIVIGNIGTYSSATATAGDPAVGKKATQAWADWVNTHGGINGHPVKLIIEDDQNDPVKSKSAVQKLVEQDHVVAIVNSNDASFDSTWAEYITSKNIPVIGGQSYGLNWVKPPFFLNGSDVITSVQDEPLAAKQAGYKKYATVLCSEAAVCAQAIPLHKSGADAAGIEFVGGLLASATAANYTAQCIQLKNGGADIVANVVSPLRFKQDCERQGYKPDWFLPASALTQQSATDLQQGIATVQTFPYFYKGPETKDYEAAMKGAGIATKDQGMVMSTSWVSGLMFQKAVELSGATGVPTTADLFKGLNAFKGETLGGLSVPLTFGDPRPDNGRIKCYFTASVKAGKLLAPNGLKSNCMA